VNSSIAIIALQTGADVADPLRDPFVNPVAPVNNDQTHGNERPALISSDSEDGNSYLHTDRMTSAHDVSWISSTTAVISHNLTTLSDQTQASSSNNETGNVTSQQRPEAADMFKSYAIVGPVMYMYFSAANTSDAGFTVDLLFQHPDFLKASLLNYFD